MNAIVNYSAILLFSLFSITVDAQRDENMVFAIEGKVFDAATKKPIADANVKLKGKDGSVYEVRTNKKGSYSFGEKAIKGERFVLPDMHYTLIVNAEGYEEAQQEEDTDNAEESTTFTVDFALQKKK